MPHSVITVVEKCGHRHSLGFIKFCRYHRKVTWIQLKDRSQATFLKEVAFDLNLRMNSDVDRCRIEMKPGEQLTAQ